MTQSVTSIDFIDVDGQRFRFELDAEDEIYSLVLGPRRGQGVQRLFVNGDDEVYALRSRGIIDMTGVVDGA